MMKVAILGFGREGQSILKFLRGEPHYPKSEFWILDASPKITIPPGVKKQLGKNYLRNLSQFDIIFRSPGIPYNLPALVRARRGGIKFSSLTKLFFERSRTHVVGVTGTKGKGTTSTLIYKILKAHSTSSGQAAKVYLAGNIGKPALDILPRLKQNSWVVLELSSFQLQDLNRSPQVAVVLDVFPDHQDSHLNLKEYYEAKTNIARHQKPRDTIFFFKTNAKSRWVAKRGRGKKIAVDETTFDWFGPEDLSIRGQHNFKNAVMAATVAKRLGVGGGIILKTIRSFRGLPHRLELVRKMKNVWFYNDSASTNPHTSAAAMRAFPGKSKILIAGGQDKNLDYAPLASALRKEKEARAVVLFGENKEKIKKAVKNSGVPIKLVSNLKTAVKTAYHVAKNLKPKTYHLKTNVIFSPGAASFDMFQNYADRGAQFKKLVKAL